MNIVTVVGARPQFIKAAVVSHALEEGGLEERIVHTGQHYDAGMSSVFFDELGIPEPHVNLNVGSSSHAVQTGDIMVGLERYLTSRERPGALLVYGDTNSTIASALVAAKMDIPLAHVEAGLRSFNMKMPEEINRIVTDRLSTHLYCPTPTAVKHLKKEGINEGVFLTGDVMLDATRSFAERAAQLQPLQGLTHHAPGTYHLATIHRAENTDHPGRLASIFDALGALEEPVLLPLHPRTRARIAALALSPNIHIMEPASYLAMLTLVSNASRVFTDSGGLQKEAVWLGVPCITLRDETEWVETTQGGWNRIVGADRDRILEASSRDPEGPPPDFGRETALGASGTIANLLHDLVSAG